MTFETDRNTVYQIRRRHRNEEVREVIPKDYAGVLVTDRGISYDAQELAAVKRRSASRTCCSRSAGCWNVGQGRPAGSAAG